DDKYYPPREVKNQISHAKDLAYDAAAFRRNIARGDYRLDQIADVYKAYEETLRKNGAMDFDDLILKTLQLFEEHPDVLAYYAGRFRYIHVDEYQDTNHVQYLLVQKLASMHGNLCVVGDDDQSIYSWRGADIHNILDFEQDFPDALVIRLEQNYRSTSPILEAANAVIAKNHARKEKHLWTAREGGEKLKLYIARDEQGEADYVCREIWQLVQTGRYRYRDIAVLYRTHAQSRVLEAAMMRGALPYRVYGGQKFYDRKEVKDAVAYLRLLRNPDDEVAFRRIINVPKRGIGDSTLEELARAAALNGESMMLCALDIDSTALPERVKAKVRPFANLMRTLMIVREDMQPGDFVEKLMREAGLIDMYQNEGTDEALERVENLKEFIGAVYEFQRSDENATLDDFLDNVALISDIDGLEEDPKSITMMTLHAAKGLEFPVVFLVGMEEGVFPHSRSLEDADQMEEERRLCYVGITRGKDRVYLTRATRRMLYNRVGENMPARFLEDIPQNVLVVDGRSVAQRPGAAQARPPQKKVSTGRSAFERQRTLSSLSGSKPAPAASRPAASAGTTQALSAGMKVSHPQFGRGTVVSVMGEKNAQVAAVAFEGRGIKQLALAIAPLTVIKKEEA
nr:3'-5' exonuclease [bacterium]